MPEFPLHAPTVDEVLDAIEGIGSVLYLESLGGVDLSPYLVRLLLQLEAPAASTTESWSPPPRHRRRRSSAPADAKAATS